MWFKNLAVYRLPAGWILSPAELEDQLSRNTLRACGPLETTTRGWVPVTPGGRLMHSLNDQHLIALGIAQKLLPGSIVRQAALERSETLAREQGFPVGRRQMRDLKMRVRDELLAQALTRRTVVRAWIDTQNGWFAVDAASPARAEELVQMLRETLGSFVPQTLDTQRSPTVTMTSWLSQGDAPLRFSLDDDLELQSPDQNKATVRYVRHPLDGREIHAHVSAGKFATRLGLTWNDRVSFVLTEKLQVKRVQFLEMEKENTASEDVDAAEQFDLDFAVMAGELAALLKDLATAVAGEADTPAWQAIKVA